MTADSGTWGTADKICIVAIFCLLVISLYLQAYGELDE